MKTKKKKFKLKLGKTEKSVLLKNSLVKIFKEANQRIKKEKEEIGGRI